MPTVTMDLGMAMKCIGKAKSPITDAGIRSQLFEAISKRLLEPMPVMDFVMLFGHHRRTFVWEIRQKVTFKNPVYFRARDLMKSSIQMLERWVAGD